MLNPQRFRATLYFNFKGFHRCYPSPCSLHFFCTESGSFAASYLINNLGFSPESAFKASKELRFKTSQKPDSVLSLFKTWGFSDSQLHHIIRKKPPLLSCKPHKRVLPKFQFLLSKGVSTSDIVSMVTMSPGFLARSLENSIIPAYELVHRFLQSDKEAIACMIRYTPFFCSNWPTSNVELLIDNGVSESNIATLLRRRPSIFCSTHLLKEVEEVKGLGFNPSTSTFCVALLAKCAVSKSRWDEKVDVFKKWGWSDETILQAFRRQPHCMLASADKINAVITFWVSQMGWDALDLVKGPQIFGCSLEKRIIPRAFIVRYLLDKGLINKNARLVTPFFLSEKLFLHKFAKWFEEDERSQLLELYQEKMNLQDNKGDIMVKTTRGT